MLQRIAEGVWAYEHDIRMPLGARLPCRATILRLTDGRLVIHSPLEIDDDVAEEIAPLGEVGFLVAPSSAHWMFLEAAKTRYPKARVFGAPGLTQKLRRLSFESLPSSGTIVGMGGVRIQHIGGAPTMDEHVFFHEASRTLVVTDLIFNVQRCESAMMRLMFRMTGTWQTTAQSRIWRFVTKDRAAAGRSATEVLRWDFERIVVAHGDVIDDHARTRAESALAWMTGGAPKAAADVVDA